MTGHVRTVAVLQQLAQSAGKRVQVVSYHEHFSMLWDAVRALDFARPVALADELIIVWDDVPVTAVSEFQFQNFLTVFDWAAGLAVAGSLLPSDQLIAALPPLRVHVLNIANPGRWPGSFSIKTSALLRSLTPWMQLYSLAEDDVAALFGIITERMPSKFTTFRDFALTAQGVDASKLIRRLWISELTRAEDRHSVSNAIGPAALAFGMWEQGNAAADMLRQEWFGDSGSPRRAFWQFLSLLGLLPYLEAEDPKREIGPLGGLASEPFFQADLFGRFRNLRFVLVDDQAGAGFHRVLAQFLLGKNARTAVTEDSEHGTPNALRPVSTSELGHGLGSFTLTSFSGPAILLAWLKKTAALRPGEPWYRSRVFGKLQDHGEMDAELQGLDILFLDLRLHGIGEAEETNASTEWVNNLLQFYKIFQKKIDSVEQRYDEKRLNALHRAIASTESFVSGGADQAENFGYLVLLPILISVCDPTVPIILFSSTRQRDIAELLRPFPNVITQFAKPVISGYADDTTAFKSSIVALTNALRQALDLHEKRLLWELVTAFDLKKATPPPCILIRAAMRGGVTSRTSERHNITENTLALSSNHVFDAILFYRILYFVIFEEYELFLIKPFEFIEACLKDQVRLAENEFLELDFGRKNLDRTDGNELPGQQEFARWESRADAVRKIKKARNISAHGKNIRWNLDRAHLRFVGMLLSLCLLYSIANDDLIKKLLSENLAPRVRQRVSGGKAAIGAIAEFERVLLRTADRFW